MLVNKIYLYDDKMTVLCNTQDGHFDVDLKEVSSLKGQLCFVAEKDAPRKALRLNGFRVLRNLCFCFSALFSSHFRTPI